MLLSRARAAEQKQLAESEKNRADKAEDEVSRMSSVLCGFIWTANTRYPQSQHSRKQLEAVQNGQTMLIDKLIACCKEVCVWLSSWSAGDAYLTAVLFQAHKYGAYAAHICIATRRVGETRDNTRGRCRRRMTKANIAVISTDPIHLSFLFLLIHLTHSRRANTAAQPHTSIKPGKECTLPCFVI